MWSGVVRTAIPIADCMVCCIISHMRYGGCITSYMRYWRHDIHTTFVIPVGRYRTNDFCVLNLRNRLNISRRRYIPRILGEIPCHVADCPLPKHLPNHDSTLRMGARARRAAGARPRSGGLSARWGARQPPAIHDDRVSRRLPPAPRRADRRSVHVGGAGRDFDRPRHSHYSGVIPMVFEHSGGRDLDLPRHSHYSGVIPMYGL